MPPHPRRLPAFLLAWPVRTHLPIAQVNALHHLRQVLLHDGVDDLQVCQRGLGAVPLLCAAHGGAPVAAWPVRHPVGTWPQCIHNRRRRPPPPLLRGHTHLGLPQQARASAVCEHQRIRGPVGLEAQVHGGRKVARDGRLGDQSRHFYNRAARGGGGGRAAAQRRARVSSRTRLRMGAEGHSHARARCAPYAARMPCLRAH